MPDRVPGRIPVVECLRARKRAVHELCVLRNAKGIDAILEARSHDLGPKASRVEDPAEWSEEKIRAAAARIDSDKGPEGDFDD